VRVRWLRIFMLVGKSGYSLRSIVRPILWRGHHNSATCQGSFHAYCGFQSLYLKREDVSEDVLNKEREIYRAQVADSGKPERVIEKIVEGKVEKYFSGRVSL